jgi:hypothetical protein
VKDDDDIKTEHEAKQVQNQADEATRSGTTEMRHRMLGRRKEQFIVKFIEQERGGGYPCPHEDEVDENFWDRQSGKLSLGASHRGDVMEEMTAQIARACEVSAHATDMACPIPHVLAQDLLDSADHELLCQVSSLPFSSLSVDRLLAHLESLRFKLSPRLTASIARRAFLVLINNHPAMESLRGAHS